MVGRGRELASIDACLDRLERGGAALVFGGEPGIGKTVVWEAGVARARRRGMRVLVVRCVESESSIAFAALSDLVGADVAEVLPLLPSPRRRALEVALLLAEPVRGGLDERAVGLALLDVMRLWARDAPVLLAIDDLQWLDFSSRRVLGMALRRRAGDDRVGLLATAREGRASSEVVEGFIGGGAGSVIKLDGLNLAGLHHLLRERVGVELGRPQLVRLREETAGNPLYALELGRELARVGARAEVGRPLPVPDSLRGLLEARLARVEDPDDVLLQTAALARPTVELLVVAGDRARTLRTLDAAVEAGILVTEESRLRFAHPLLVSVCYRRAPVWRRRAAHRALAGVVDSVEERARHLALAAEASDGAIADEVERAAQHAVARGATAAAADLYELAAELTPDSGRGRRRLLRAAELHRLAGAGARGAAFLEQLLSEAAPGPERADVLVALAATFRTSPARAIELLNDAEENARGDDARLARILAWRAWLRAASGAGLAEALADGREAVVRAERVGDLTLLAIAISQQGATETWASEITRGVLERGVAIERELPHDLEHHQSPRFALARRLWRLGDIDEARAILEELSNRAYERGDEETHPLVSGELTTLEWFAGNWTRARELIDTCYSVAEQSLGPAYLVWVGRGKAMLETDLGLVDEARATAEEALALAEGLGSKQLAGICRGALGRLAFALGDVDAAGGHLSGVSEALRAGTLNDPTNPVWSDAIETLIARGETGEAQAHLDRQELLARRLGGPWALAAASRGRGLIALAGGDLPDAIEQFERALVLLDGRFPLEVGRTLLCLGGAHRNAKRKRAARDALEQSFTVFSRLEARLWAARADAELRRISGRRRSSQLTETEARVAELAAQGRSNKQIAAGLFVSEHTVAAHLSHVYRKLGVQSRTELAHRLAARGDAAKV